MNDQHERKCHDCGNVAIHEDRITPWVLCKKCGSQDTRPTKPPPPTREQQLESTVAELVGLLRECELFLRVIGLDSPPAASLAEQARTAIAKHGGAA